MSFRRSVLRRIQVASVPVLDPELYSVTLDGRHVEVLIPLGASANDIAGLIADAIEAQFSEIRAEADLIDVLVSGHVEPFTMGIGRVAPKNTPVVFGAVSANLLLAPEPDLEPRAASVGACRVLAARDIYRRTSWGDVEHVQNVRLRELDSGHVFDAASDAIVTLVARREDVK